MTTTDPHRTWLALLLTVLDGECEARARELLGDGEPCHCHAGQVAHHAAHRMVATFDLADHPEMRVDLAAELLTLAGEDPDP